MYCLWFGNQKIHDLNQLKNNFDFDAAEMYLLGGGLSRWLRQCGENEIAARVENIDLTEDISRQLAEIFSVKLPANRKSITALSKEINAIPVKKIAVLFPSLGRELYESEKSGVNPDFGSFNSASAMNSNISAGSFEIEIDSFNRKQTGSLETNADSFSFTLGSFEKTVSSFGSEYFSSSFSLLAGSFELSSFNNFFGFESGLGSGLGFGVGSFASGSFNLSEYEYEYESSFNISSFGSGSFVSGSFSNSKGINTANTDTEFKGENINQAHHADIAKLSAEEKIQFNITLCPLNRFGYGINLV